MRIQGVYPPIATPFDDRGHLNCKALAANIQRWDETGLNGYVIAGSNGENVLLDTDEIATAVRGVRRAAAPGKLVIAGQAASPRQPPFDSLVRWLTWEPTSALVMTPSFYSVEMTDAGSAAPLRSGCRRFATAHPDLQRAQVHASEYLGRGGRSPGRARQDHRGQG